MLCYTVSNTVKTEEPHLHKFTNEENVIYPIDKEKHYSHIIKNEKISNLIGDLELVLHPIKLEEPSSHTIENVEPVSLANENAEPFSHLVENVEFVSHTNKNVELSLLIENKEPVSHCIENIEAVPHSIENEDPRDINFNGEVNILKTIEEEPAISWSTIEGQQIRQRTYICYHCGHKTKLRRSLKCHIKIYHYMIVSARQNNTQTLKRAHCNYSTVNYKRHLIQCPHCEYTTVRLDNLKTHVRAKHSDDEPLQCPHCKYSTFHSFHLKRHMVAKHVRKPLKCHFCKYSTVNSFSLKQHMFTRHIIAQPLKCSHCEYSTMRSSNLKRHMLARHSVPELSQYYYSKVQSDKNDMLDALMCQAPGAKDTPLCLNLTANDSAQVNKAPDHVSSYPIGKKRNKTREMTKCAYTKHSDTKPLQCPDCKYSTVHSFHLKRHMMAKHVIQPLKCHHCKYSTVHLFSLKQHMLARHIIAQPLKCSHCEYSTMRSYHLKRHMLARHFVAELTQYSHSKFKSHNFTNHFKSRNTDKQPLKSAHDEYSVIQSDNRDMVDALMCQVHGAKDTPVCLDLTANESSHINEAPGQVSSYPMSKKYNKTRETTKCAYNLPFQCPHCEYNTIRSDNLKTHVRAKHSDTKPLQCPQCKYSTVHSFHLKRHMITRHNVIQPLK